MPWTVPRTWVTGEVFASSTANQHIRDNLLSLHDNRVSSIPGSPVDQDEIVYVADASGRVLWRLKYYSAGTAGKQWEFVGGSPLASTVSGIESLGATSSYLAFTTVVQHTVPLGGEYYSAFGAVINDASGIIIYVSPKFGSTGAVDTDATQSIGVWSTPSRQSDLKTLVAGDTIALQYRQNTATAGDQVGSKFLRTFPRRVG